MSTYFDTALNNFSLALDNTRNTDLEKEELYNGLKNLAKGLGELSKKMEALCAKK